MTIKMATTTPARGRMWPSWPRPAPAGIVYSLVYPQLTEGSYELYIRPREPVALTVEIAGGYVTEAVWPS